MSPSQAPPAWLRGWRHIVLLLYRVLENLWPLLRSMAILSVTPTLRRLGLVTAHTELVNQLANVAEMTMASSLSMRPSSSSSGPRPTTRC